MKIDEKDMKIIDLLRMNSRASYSELSKELNISETAVRKRINKLVREGVIKRFTIDYELESEIKAFVLVKTSTLSKTPEISFKILNDVEGVEDVYEITGEYDIIAFIRGRNMNDLNRCIDKIRSIQGVASTYTMIVLRKPK